MKPDTTSSLGSENRARAPLDPSSQLIIEEAERRGIAVEVLAPRAEYFRLRLGPRALLCRESLSELTTAVALSICDDKRMTARVLQQAGLRTPTQVEAGSRASNAAFLRERGPLVVKPARGEQGRGISVGISTPDALEQAVERAASVGTPVLLEEVVRGDDLRLLVIGHELVAAAVRRPPVVCGDGHHTIEALIVAQSERRMAETHGESQIPIDAETLRCVREAGFELDAVLPKGQVLTVRGTANVHLGGTITDVTAELHPGLREVAIRASQALAIPVVGLDLIVGSIAAGDYWILEANERPGLANHEPQPTAARFVDLLFPESRR